MRSESKKKYATSGTVEARWATILVAYRLVFEPQAGANFRPDFRLVAEERGIAVKRPTGDGPMSLCEMLDLEGVGVRPAGTAKRISEWAKAGIGALSRTEGTDQQEPMEVAKTNANVFASFDRSRTVGRATCGLLTFSARE